MFIYSLSTCNCHCHRKDTLCLSVSVSVYVLECVYVYMYEYVFEHVMAVVVDFVALFFFFFATWKHVCILKSFIYILLASVVVWKVAHAPKTLNICIVFVSGNRLIDTYICTPEYLSNIIEIYWPASWKIDPLYSTENERCTFIAEQSMHREWHLFKVKKKF